MPTALERAARDLLRLPDLSIEILDSLPIAVFVVDAKGRIRIANGRAQLLSGYHRSELYAMAIDELVPEAQRERHRTAHRPGYMLDPRERPMGTGGRLGLQRRDGSVAQVAIMLRPLPSPEGMLVIVVAQRHAELEA